MSKKKEYSNVAEIASFLHVDKGQARVKAYTAVNEDLKVDQAELTKKIGGVKVYMHVEEDCNVKKDGSFYEKNIFTEQVRDNDNGSYNTVRPANTSEYEQPPVNKDGLSPLQVLKNFVDNLAADFRQDRTAQWIVIVGLAVLVGVAITLHFVR